MKEALIGGAFIGVATSILLLFNGRIAGVSGIFWEGVRAPKKEFWRVSFIAGIIFAALFFQDSFIEVRSIGLLKACVAGFLVGLGTYLGNGCTSGHGVCGLSRFSFRSLVATITFILFGIVTVYLEKFL